MQVEILEYVNNFRAFSDMLGTRGRGGRLNSIYI
jgi:hypothetical protein